MSEYELDMSKHTIDDQPIMWTDAEYREAFQSLYFEYHKIKRERDKLEVENKELKHENKALRLQSDTYFNEWQEAEMCIKKLKEEIRKLKGED